MVEIDLYLYARFDSLQPQYDCLDGQLVVFVESGSGVFGSYTNQDVVLNGYYSTNWGSSWNGNDFNLLNVSPWPRNEFSMAFPAPDTFPGTANCVKVTDYATSGGTKIPSQVWNNTNTTAYNLPFMDDAVCAS